MTVIAASRSSFGREIQEDSRWDLFLIAFFGVGLILFTTPWFQHNFQGRFLFILVLTALGVPTLVALAVARSTEPRTRLAARVGIAFLAVALLAAMVSGRFVNSLFGLIEANGLLLTCALLGAWALGKSLRPNATGLLELVLLGCALLNAGVAIAQGATGLGLIDARAPGFFENPVFVAPILVGGLWLAVTRAASNVWLLGGCVVLLAAAIQTSGSRAALLALPIIVGATAWTSGWRLAGVVTAALVLGLACGAGAVRIGGEQTSSTTRATQSATSGAFTTRIEAWSMATHAIRDRPVLGAGPGRFRAATGEYHTLKLTRAEPTRGLQFGDAHNIIIEYTVTTGLIGVALLIAFLVIALPTGRWFSPLGGFAVLGLLMHLLEPQHAIITPALFFAMGAAVPLVVVAGKKPAERQAEKRVERRVMVARSILVVVALGEAVLIALGARTLNRLEGFIKKSDVPELQDSLQTATWQLPFSSEPYSGLAVLDDYLVQQGDRSKLADEVKHQRQAAERQPEFADYWARLAVSQEKAGDYEGAKASFRKALEVNPWAAEVQVRYAKLLMSHGENDEARRQLEHAVLALADRSEADALLAQLDSSAPR